MLPSFGDSIIVKEPGAARQALAVLSLTEEIIESIADAAATAKADTMAVEPLNAPGTNAYNKGVAAKRIALLPRGWRMSHDRGIEATVNDDLGIQLVFQNVDAACLERDPQAVSGKGSGARKLVYEGQRQNVLFERKEESPQQARGAPLRVWLVCVSTSDKKLRAEVSCPLLFEGNQFEGFSKRIFVIDRDYDPTPKARAAAGDRSVDDAFEVKIAKKK
ncbi:MAG: hypothetical protein J0H69_00075 [Burkholderiales bacterium]|nr:hypothetical protein [Burkholderiales bacterium]